MGKQKPQPQVKIIAGEFKGRRLAYPDKGVFRPSMAKTREALFSVLHGLIAGRAFVDLFCSGGGVGMEALSRGASVAHFVEHEKQAIDLLRRNLDACAVQGHRYRLYREDAFGFLERGTLGTVSDAIVFADPPYEGDETSKLLAHFRETEYKNMLLLILEHRVPIDTTDIEGLQLSKTKRFGDTRLTFWSRVK